MHFRLMTYMFDILYSESIAQFHMKHNILMSMLSKYHWLTYFAQYLAQR